ncbi:MAG: hypothetical protein NVS1B5_13790 [Gemmatimonadaceae bacterium]
MAKLLRTKELGTKFTNEAAECVHRRGQRLALKWDGEQLPPRQDLGL